MTERVQSAVSAPASADGAVALAKPARAARWLTSHPQALVLLKLAAPTANKTLPRIRGFLVALASEARGPFCVWWRGAELAVGAEVVAEPAKALRQLAALEGHRAISAQAVDQVVGVVVKLDAAAVAAAQNAYGAGD